MCVCVFFFFLNLQKHLIVPTNDRVHSFLFFFSLKTNAKTGVRRMAYGRNFSEYFSSSSDFLFALGTNWFFVYEHMLLLIESLTTTRLGFWLYIHFLHEICTRARTHFSPENDQSSGQNWIFLRIFCIFASL